MRCLYVEMVNHPCISYTEERLCCVGEILFSAKTVDDQFLVTVGILLIPIFAAVQENLLPVEQMDPEATMERTGHAFLKDCTFPHEVQHQHLEEYL